MDRRVIQARQSIVGWFEAALAAVEPAAAVQRSLRREGASLFVKDRAIEVRSRLLVVGVGKAAVPMARGVEGVCGDLVSDGLVITKDGHVGDASLRRIRVAEAAHPVPDKRGVTATREILDLVGGLTSDDVIVTLISGGGSALLEAPRPPVTLADLAVTTDLLLRAGAPIHDLNAVRSPLSLVKSGGLLHAIGPATSITLVLSDVLGNDPSVIASGPMTRTPRDPKRALALLDRYGIRSRVPAVVIETLTSDSDGQRGVDLGDAGAEAIVVGDNPTAVSAVAEAALRDGIEATLHWAARQGEAAELGRRFATDCLQAPTAALLLGGGEATVTVVGDGVGGRNTEFALAAAVALADAGSTEWVVASLATDGQDGPTNVAGAIADGGTIKRARDAGVDPARSLDNNDSLRVFRVAGGIVDPGPTGTNVNDLYIGLRLDALGT